MDHTHSVCPETGQAYMDFDWNDFVTRLFTQPPQDPFSFYMEFLTEMTEAELSKMLGMMLVNGAKQKYNKEIAHLLPNEIGELQMYYRSIGFEVEYKVETQERYIAEKGKMMPVNMFQIDFKPCSQSLNKQNQPRYDDIC
jgi:hypothetical protein